MFRPVRRIVTGHDAAGKSIILSDGEAKNLDRPIPIAPDNVLINLWMSERPTDFMNFLDPAENPIPLAPPKNGTIFRFVDFPPESTFIHMLDKKNIEATWSHLSSDQSSSQKEGLHPLMHKTNTIDYIIVLSGEIYLILEKSETLLKAGDVVIQRGTNHAWSNRTQMNCRVAAILISAESQ